MDTWQRRTAGYVAGLVALMLAFTVSYDWGLRTFEGQSQPLYQSLQHVVETFTATGYGSQAPWTTPR